MKSNTLRLEMLMASTLPVAAVLLVGMEALKRMENTDISLFLLVLLACAAGVFFGEMALIRLMQRAVKEQFQEVVLGCQEYIAGNRSKRLTVHGDNALTSLANVLNTLFEAIAREKPPTEKPIERANVQPAASSQAAQVEVQLQKLIQEITPVMSGDLRVHANVPSGNVGIIADICNALIEEIVELVQWTRYSAEQVTGGTRTLLSGSIELAEAVETQMLRFSQTTEAVEKLVAFLQRLSSSLHMSFENMQEIQTRVQQRTRSMGETDDFLQQLHTEAHQQAQLLEDILNSTQSNTTLAEAMISDFYAFAKRIHASSTGILQTAEHINTLSSLAEQWHNAVVAFQLPDAAHAQLTQAASATGSLAAIRQREQ